MEIKDGVQQEITISSGILDSIFEYGELFVLRLWNECVVYVTVKS